MEYQAGECAATLYFTIKRKSSKEAYNLGNAGWKAYENKDYELCLGKSKQALKIDNTLWYVHFNIALIYLIEENPKAFDKYKFSISMCDKQKILKGGYNDILEYESKQGKLKNSEKIKNLFKSKIK